MVTIPGTTTAVVMGPGLSDVVGGCLNHPAVLLANRYEGHFPEAGKSSQAAYFLSYSRGRRSQGSGHAFGEAYLSLDGVTYRNDSLIFPISGGMLSLH